MKYYAVTDDPNELMHYGIKGMKWGVIRTDAQLGHPKKLAKPRSKKPKSPAYMKAAAKLSSAMQNGIAKAQANWKVYNSPANKQLRAEKREYNKAVRDYKRGERLFEKHVQLARQGRLKYKGISDGEVQRITDRLMLENRARIQSGNEKQSFRRRLNSAIGEGIIGGVGQGTSLYISARMRKRGEAKGDIQAERMKAHARSSIAGRIAQSRNRRADLREERGEIRNDRKLARKNAKAQEREQFYKDFYKAKNEEGLAFRGTATLHGKRRMLRRVNALKEKEAEHKKLEEETKRDLAAKAERRIKAENEQAKRLYDRDIQLYNQAVANADRRYGVDSKLYESQLKANEEAAKAGKPIPYKAPVKPVYIAPNKPMPTMRVYKQRDDERYDEYVKRGLDEFYKKHPKPTEQRIRRRRR